MIKNTRAFSFVELIVVLVILAILSTIGFVVYESYLSTGRDTKRIADLRGMHQSLSIYAAKSKLPLPNEKLDISYSGAIFQYQGDITNEIAKTAGFKGDIYDKELDVFPVYLLGKNRKDFQLMSFLEDPASQQISMAPKVSAFTDYENLYPKVIGKPMGILLDESKTPLHRNDVLAPSDSFEVSDAASYSVDGQDYVIQAFQGGTIGEEINSTNAFSLLPNYSCKRILEMGKSVGDKEYIVNDEGNGNIRVHCDMRNGGLQINI